MLLRLLTPWRGAKKRRSGAGGVERSAVERDGAACAADRRAMCAGRAAVRSGGAPRAHSLDQVNGTIRSQINV